MTEKKFQTIVQYGGIALGLCIVLNIWVVMRNVEIYHDATHVEAIVEQMLLRDQILQGVAQDFNARANSDANIAAIIKKAQAMAAPSVAPVNQSHP